MRIAWFSPFPPVRSGVAIYSAELVTALRGSHQIDVFVDENTPSSFPGARSAHDFVWRHRQSPYELTIFQLGNSSHHDYMWPYVFRYPGLVVLHDVHLHHARAASLLRQRRASHYRAEFARNHPDTNPDLAELAVAGFDNHLHYNCPMTPLVIRASRLTAVHSARLAELAREQVPAGRIDPIHLGHGTAVSTNDALAARHHVCSRYRIPSDAVVFGCFGGLSPEKRIPQLLRAFASIRRHVPSAHLLLAGAPAEHYDLLADVTRWRLEQNTTLTGYLDAGDEFDACIAACDVGLNLRWPTAREISGPWVRCLAAGKPTIIIDLVHLTDVPSLDPRTWQPNNSMCGATDDALPAPICIAIDILDEAHSLKLAMQRLAIDAGLRAELGSAARAYWSKEHSFDAMVSDYLRLIPAVASTDASSAGLPEHLIDDGDRRLRELLQPFGVPCPLR
jgi:glycosyltransferase involved in cell wall biosynthesis